VGFLFKGGGVLKDVRDQFGGVFREFGSFLWRIAGRTLISVFVKVLTVGLFIVGGEYFGGMIFLLERLRLL
jgi:hypothetical protein